MNERLVEDWLSKASERSFQTPFAQALLAEGMEVLRVGHSAHEHGKDIIAVDAKGKVHVYQLKDGNLDIKNYEAGLGQLSALVETQVEHPGLTGQPKHQSWLVISGEASIPVADRIRVQNLGWKKRGYGTVQLVNGAQLVAKFSRMAGDFWPQKPEDSRRLLTFYLADGKGTLDRDEFALLIGGVTAPSKTRSETSRRLAAANLFASYALAPFYSSANYWELVQAWTITAAQIAWTADCAGLPRKAWHSTFRLAVDAALDALNSLAAESLEPHALAPGPMFELDELTRSRCTICAGVMAARVLIGRGLGECWPEEAKAKQKLEDLQQRGRLTVWGESAVPMFLSIMWAMDKLRADRWSDQILLSILAGVANTNSARLNYKLAPPHDSADDAIEVLFQRMLEKKPVMEVQAAAAYTLEPLVTLAARRLWRNTLAGLWSEISKTTLVRLAADHPRDLLLWNWRHQCGSNDSRNFATPQSWAELLAEARRPENASLPAVLLAEYDFSWLFLLCFPHRLTRATVKHYEAVCSRLT
ncbi:MAG: hypothetical protein Q7S40_34220 [Opitutaceae bacterium]|nr:hypothetical protein [Opitutaceae bacterium]